MDHVRVKDLGRAYINRDGNLEIIIEGDDAGTGLVFNPIKQKWELYYWDNSPSHLYQEGLNPVNLIKVAEKELS